MKSIPGDILEPLVVLDVFSIVGIDVASGIILILMR